MENIITVLETILTHIVQLSVTILELFGVFILVYTAIHCFISWIRKDHFVRLNLAQGIALALEFKLGGEVLRTVITRNQSELFILGAIILLRGVLTFLIHWEIKNEEKALEKRSAIREPEIRPKASRSGRKRPDSKKADPAGKKQPKAEEL
jgi:uncharacterized membrane protein